MTFADMGSGDQKTLRNFHRNLSQHHLQQHHQGKKQEMRDVPKGCLAIKVGQGEEQQRFVVPVIYFNHPLFMQLLKEAEEEYGFDQKGTINIPCQVEEFRYVQGMIDREKSLHHHHHHHLIGCFGV
ncbi:auxin-responsive protein SAUR32-like [Juglans microcarpa x Juglans regia]|uniref:auxin-responsive protein SAUR32-like n=1 Tax=Juglans microcarpa x Juglans regia TaxID=2249226 RepID=UPI001B7F1A54|nr:auxin-responsive protein SAUR32-like [Juglans microcarpa x Juglans regia]